MRVAGRGVRPLRLAGLLALVAGGFALLRPSVPPPLRVGAPAPDFRLAVLPADDQSAPPEPRSLSELRGRVVFVNFWATWCPPCRDEAPSLDRLHRTLGPRGLEVLAVSIDEPGATETVAEFGRELGLGIPILLDPERDAYRRYQATGVPETFIVGPEGLLVERVVGPRDWDHPRYAALVGRLLDSGPSGAVQEE